MLRFNHFDFQDTTEKSMNETERIHNSMTRADTCFEQFMSKLSTSPLCAPTYPRIGLFFCVSSLSNLLDDETALLNGEKDGKNRLSSITYNLFRTHHFIPWQGNVFPSQIFTNFSEMAQGHCPGKFPLHTSPAIEPTKGVVTPESSPVKSRFGGN